MSRSLGQTQCHGFVVIAEDPRPITKKEAGVYFSRYEGMLVANAFCPYCLAKYLAWIDERPMVCGNNEPVPRFANFSDPDNNCFDLSYRSTFDDEPGEADGPLYEVVQTYERVKRIR